MNYFLVLGMFLLTLSFHAVAINCPDPQTTSLREGIPPKPWVENPYSPNSPQGEVNTRFIRVKILVIRYGEGVLCTYENSIGEFSIWWKGLTRIPAPIEIWAATLGGYECDKSLLDCQFTPINFQ